MSVSCPDCGVVAGYGRELAHKSDCPALIPQVPRRRRDDKAGPSHPDPDHRAECDRYMKSGGVRRAFVTILEPGKIPNGKGPFLTVEHLDQFVRSALAHHTDPTTHIIIHQLTWNGELWTECARERAAIDAALDGVDFEALNVADETEGEG